VSRKRKKKTLITEVGKNGNLGKTGTKSHKKGKISGKDYGSRYRRERTLSRGGGSRAKKVIRGKA